MNSLFELNTYSGRDLTYTDLRGDIIKFDRTTPVDQEVFTAANVKSYLPIGINIIELNTDAFNVFFEINLLGMQNGPPEWDFFPSNWTLTNPSTGVYRIYGIDTFIDWYFARRVKINSASLLGTYTYKASINYTKNSTPIKLEWSVACNVGISVGATATASMLAKVGITQPFESNMVVRFKPTSITPTRIYPSFISTSNALVSSQVTPLYQKIGYADNSADFIMSALPPNKIAGLTLTMSSSFGSSVDIRKIANGITTATTSANMVSNIVRGYSLLTTVRAPSAYVYQNTDRYGRSLTMSTNADYLGIGAPFKNAGSRQGYAFMYSKSSSDAILNGDVLQGSDTAFNDRFATSISMSGDGLWLAVGADGEDDGDPTDTGAVYLFSRSGNTWTEQQIIKNPTADEYQSDYFGESVALSNDGTYLAIGRPQVDNPSANGQVLIYTKSGSTWSYATTLMPTISDVGMKLKMTPNGTWLVIGGSNGISIYMRNGSIWTLYQTIFYSAPSTPTAIDITPDGKRMVVGLTSSEITACSAKVYRFTGLEWVLEATLTPGDLVNYAYFGSGVGISAGADIIMVGAPGRNPALGDNITGSVYVFTRRNTTWTQQTKISSDTTSDMFGGNIYFSTDANYVMVSAEYADVGSRVDQGEVRIYKNTGA